MKTEATETNDPPPLAFAPPADGTYTVRVTEKFRGRAGANFVYRLRVSDGAEKIEPGFRLTVPTNVFTVQRGGTLKVKVKVAAARSAWLQGADRGPVGRKDLPKRDVDRKSPVTLAANQQTTGSELHPHRGRGCTGHRCRAARSSFHRCLGATASSSATSRCAPVRRAFPGVGSVPDSTELRLTVAAPPTVPFKIIDEYVMTESAPRGRSTYYRRAIGSTAASSTGRFRSNSPTSRPGTSRA